MHSEKLSRKASNVCVCVGGGGGGVESAPQQQQLLLQQPQWHVMHLLVPSPSLQHDSLHSSKSSHDQEWEFEHCPFLLATLSLPRPIPSSSTIYHRHGSQEYIINTQDKRTSALIESIEFSTNRRIEGYKNVNLTRNVRHFLL